MYKSQLDRRPIYVSKHHRDLLNRAAAAADLSAKEVAEALIEALAGGDVEVVRVVFARIKRK